MSEISMYETQKKKMDGLCEEHELSYRFRKDVYPVTFTVTPLQGMDAQIDMLENVEEKGYRSPDASMTWIFRDGTLQTKVQGGTFTISKTLRTKIENILIKMITYWMQYFFRDVMERHALADGVMPVIDEFEDDEEQIEGDAAAEEDDEPVERPTAAELEEATTIIRMENKATASLLQRRMKGGITNLEAVHILNKLEEMKVISPVTEHGPREVLPFDEPEDQDDEN